MKKAFIVHGAYGSPNENWFPWLHEELEKLGYAVYVPPFPTPKHQSLEEWKDKFQDYKQQWGDKETIIIGHSIGVAFALRMLMSRIGPSLRASFFVSGFTTPLNDSRFDDLNRSFLEEAFDWDLIKKNCQEFFVYHSDNDPYVPLEKGKEIAKKLDTNVQLIQGAGHFNEEAGYTTFDKLLEDIKKL